ncbi:MAG TPA: FeoB-associated Cys-rich membrane protein [Lachnospiraceae bacterium]
MATVIVGIVVVGIVAAIIRKMVKDKKAGKSVICGGGCKDCGGHCNH